MAYDIECSMKTASELKRHREEQMLVLMHMWDDIYGYEESNTALLDKIWCALHDLMKGIDTCQKLLGIEVEYDKVSKELVGRGAVRKHVSRGVYCPLTLLQFIHAQFIETAKYTLNYFKLF